MHLTDRQTAEMDFSGPSHRLPRSRVHTSPRLTGVHVSLLPGLCAVLRASGSVRQDFDAVRSVMLFACTVQVVWSGLRGFASAGVV